MFKPTITAIVCALGLSIVTVQAGEEGDLRDVRISQQHQESPAQGIDNHQLAADTRIMARVPGAHEAYGWRYPNAFESSPALIETPDSRWSAASGNR